MRYQRSDRFLEKQRDFEEGRDGPWYMEYRTPKKLHEMEPAFKNRFRRYASAFADPEDALSEVLQRLLCDKLPNVTLKDRSNLDGLVATAFTSVTMDQVVREHGKWRAPKEIADRGKAHAAACFAYRVLKLPIEQVIEQSVLDEASVRDTITRFIALNPDVLRRTRVSMSWTDVQELVEEFECAASASADPTGESVQAQDDQVAHALVQGLIAPRDELPAYREGLEPAHRERLDTMRTELVLNDLDRLLLRRVQHGRPTLVRIAKLHEQGTSIALSEEELEAYLTELLARLERLLSTNGYDADAVLAKALDRVAQVASPLTAAPAI